MLFEEHAENIATVLIDGSTIFLLAGVFMVTGIMRKRGRKDDQLFVLLIVLNTIVAVSDIITYLADGKSFMGARYFNMGGVSVFYMALVMQCMVWMQYCLERFKNELREKKIDHKYLFVPGLIMEAVLVVNFFAGFVFYVDKDNVYHYGVLFIPMFIVLGFYVIVSFILVGRYRSAGAGRKLIPVWIFFLPLFAGLIVPFVLGGISLTSIGCAISITFTHLGSASEVADTEGH